MKAVISAPCKSVFSTQSLFVQLLFVLNAREETGPVHVCQWVFSWHEVKNTSPQAKNLTLPPLSGCQHDITGDPVSAYQR